MDLQTLKQKYVDGLRETNAFLVKSIDETPFTLRSGKQSYMFLDHSLVASSPKAYKSFIDIIIYLLNQVYGDKPFILCNVDSKISAQMVGSVAYQLNKAQIIFKSKALTEIEKGPQKQLRGNTEWNLPVAILDDMMSGGDGTAKKVADLVLETFPKINDIQIVVGFVREKRHSTFPTHFALTRDELIEIVQNKLTEGQLQAIKKELHP